MMTLKQASEAKGVKQAAIAKYLGVSRQTYASYESRQEEMSISQAKAVCKYLGYPVEQIFFAEEVK